MKIVHVSGKRKRAIARATLMDGKGIVRVNNQLLEYYGNELTRMKINEALMLAGDYANKVNINVDVNSGGWEAQGEAIRLAIARGLVEFSRSDKLKKAYLDYDRHLLIADTRRTEPCKPNDSGKPRKKRQKSYR